MIPRSTFISASLVLAAAASAADPSEAADVGLVERAGEFDVAAFSKRVSQDADIRQVWDAGKLNPMVLGAVKNSLNGLQFGFGIPPSRIATAFVAHNDSNVLLYGDAAWTTYQIGQVFAVHDPTGATVTSNIFAPARNTSATTDPSDVHGFYQDASITTLQKRGVLFFICNTALVQQSHQIANSGVAPGQSPGDIARGLRRSLLPGVTLVPSGVAVIAFLQSRYHYGHLAEE